VFVIRNKKAEFVPVDTGISGTTDIEVTSGVKEGDDVITGSYKVLRTLKPGRASKSITRLRRRKMKAVRQKVTGVSSQEKPGFRGRRP